MTARKRGNFIARREPHCARSQRSCVSLRVHIDLRSNQGGVAVSGEITLHHDRVYIQVCQPATGADSGILIRTCDGRRDYEGGRNHLAPLSLLDHPAELAGYVRAVMSGDLLSDQSDVRTARAQAAGARVNRKEGESKRALPGRASPGGDERERPGPVPKNPGDDR